jgi:hypothetical protein
MVILEVMQMVGTDKILSKNVLLDKSAPAGIELRQLNGESNRSIDSVHKI